ncbi:hypothetical protein [Aliiglaciecola lipolytica]|uniref:Uncharacterized protein n=1 Tax=Aliiglaciecola lipolytica E3 TaxID=1127673 RepID=K6WZM5_9ALTE|nr:hypothetical protein [Aliiglaciecola lipolytica]GAC13859.1 hypothetical protein GLIP_1218 [Aliiglaciecola lipolytica E3]
MNIMLVQFAVQSIVRLGTVTKDIAEQRARNTSALLPGLDPQDLSRETIVNGIFTSNSAYKKRVQAEGDLVQYWDSNCAKSDKDSIDCLYVAILKQSAEEGVDFEAALVPCGTTLINQFDPGRDPNLSPFARIALTAADILLEYIAINPSLASDNPNSQKLISAFSANMAAFLPNSGDFGEKEKFAQRIASGFLRAGLKTLCAHPDWVVQEEHVKTLLSNSLTPVVNSFPTSIAEQIKWQQVTESIVGPAAKAALETLATNQHAFLGDAFLPNTAMGAVTQALLLEAAKDGLKKPFSEQRFIGLYRAMLGVAKSNPKLFVKGDQPQHEVARNALKSFSTVLENAAFPFNQETGTKLFAEAINVVGQNAHRFADADNQWQTLAVDIFKNLTTSMADSINKNKGITNILSAEKLTEIGQIVLVQISANPTLIAGPNKEWHGVIAAITSAMAADKHLLLTANNWKVIASVAAAEAASNPARLFKLGSSSADILGAKLITVILKSASKAMNMANGKELSVLVGATLQEAITISLTNMSGNAKAIRDNLSLFEELLDELNELAVSFPMEIGSKEWLHLLRVLLGSVLEGISIGNLSIETANKLLKGE